MTKVEEGIVNFFIEYHNKPMRVDTIKALCPEVRDMKLQKIVCILAQMRNKGVIERTSMVIEEGGFWNRKRTHVAAFHLA